ncbi:hypothetical protein [Elizabethkingia anophelis]|uniref:hypothetical protein n=1 Tax=Elizabethkingia anophelis TaxID=1117645 RepID=UPI00291CF703|nr:hypothetical protein [Elizabethkingia anophelis]MDV4098742.1 hypothetical protein [Elizabethkingia anophelis]WMC07774.1 MAG: hypothetical protein PQ275_23930 [Elizabethkingia anophelis]HAY3557023.1 hypothetical protein [Elizabethkingia meningoseptica]
MKKSITTILPVILFISALVSCNKTIKSEKGGIDIISNVYFNASKNLEKMQNFHVSRLNYSGDSIIELVPDLQVPGITNAVYFIQDSLYYDLGQQSTGNIIISEIKKAQKGQSIFDKKAGAIFTKEWVPNYMHRKNISDTVLFGKTYKRFEINAPESFTRYYVYPTDTILPYSLYKQADKDYKGRIERIDSYNKKKDIFVTLQLLPRAKWDKDAKEIFEFNQFVKNKAHE